MKTAAIIVAAGRGTRVGGEIPKQYQMLAGKPVLAHSVQRFLAHPAIAQVVVVIHPDDADLFAQLGLEVETCLGGVMRGESVQLGLACLGDDIDAVLIHDGARPLVGADLLARLIVSLQTCEAAAPALAVTDALWFGGDGKVSGVQDRSALYRAQTPQAFQLVAIRAAYRMVETAQADDVAVARAAGIDVLIVDGDEVNIKITTPEDFQRAEVLLRGQMDIRCGNGYDVHAFEAGDHVTLCGVDVPHSAALKGHSDADVAMHAITDAIYGALAEGDIGQWFPPSEIEWKGAASDIFLKHAAELARSKGFAINHIDCTIVCELPKIGPHALAMRECLDGILNIGIDRISVKATTSERLGFTGRGEGIAAMATATLVTS